MDVVNDLEQEQDIEGRYAGCQNDYDDEGDDEFVENMPENLKKHKIKVRPDQKIFKIPVRKTKER